MKKLLGRCQGADAAADDDDDDGAAAAEAAEAEGGGGRKKKGGCSHGPDAEDCNKFCFTAVHKGEWELTCWQDSKLIVNLNNFFSATRAGILARGSHRSPTSFNVWAPEGTWYYNIEGRSPTDGNDQQRKKLTIAGRRTQRLGTKQMLFGLDLALTDGSIIWEDLGLAAKLPAAQQAKRTKVQFCLDYAQEVFNRVAPMRQRTPVGMCIMQAQVTNSAEYCSPASAHVMARTEHELVDMGEVTRALGFRTCKAKKGPKKRKGIPKGTCFYTDCPGVDGGLKKTTQLRCTSCKDGKGAYYHLPCFFRTHRCCVGA